MTDKRSIVFNVTNLRGDEGPITGFRYIWAFYVKGYNPAKHCQPGLIGHRVNDFCTGRAMSGRSVTCDQMDRYPYLYVCGVAAGSKSGRKEKNLHLPLRYAAGAVVEATTHSGFHFRIENAEKVDVPALPEGWEGKPREHTRCKNFQFAVACFGYPPRVASSPATFSLPTKGQSE
jgi:hypothetical protein